MSACIFTCDLLLIYILFGSDPSIRCYHNKELKNPKCFFMRLHIFAKTRCRPFMLVHPSLCPQVCSVQLDLKEWLPRSRGPVVFDFIPSPCLVTSTTGFIALELTGWINSIALILLSPTSLPASLLFAENAYRSCFTLEELVVTGLSTCLFPWYVNVSVCDMFHVTSASFSLFLLLLLFL